MLNRRQVLGCLGATVIMPTILLDYKPKRPLPTEGMWWDDVNKKWRQNPMYIPLDIEKLLGKDEIFLCDLLARSLVGKIVAKLKEDNITTVKVLSHYDVALEMWVPQSSDIQVYADPSIHRCYRIGWYGYVEANYKGRSTGYAACTDVNFNKFRINVTDGIAQTIATSAPAHESVRHRAAYYWQDMWTRKNFDMRDHEHTIARERVVCL